MTTTYLYLSVIPQALIASMLAPDDFGRYYAVGTKVHSRGEAIFFDVDPAGLPDGVFPLELVPQRCVPKPDGTPKRSVYLSIYRVLSRIPVSALGRLHLVTRDGQTLSLDRAAYAPETERRPHLYQEFCPVNPLVASMLEPLAFCRNITDPSRPVHVPRLVFSQLSLRGMAENPVSGLASDLPYPNLSHLRDVLADLICGEAGPSKLVLKQVNEGVYYRTVRGGFYVGDQRDFAFYPFPSVTTLETHHFNWWRSAQRPAMEV